MSTPRRVREIIATAGLMVGMAMLLAAVFFTFDATQALADGHVTITESSRGTPDAAVIAQVQEQETQFFDRGLGKRLRHLCTGAAILGGILAVIRAALKGLFGRQQSGGMGGMGGGGGVGQYFKQLILPLVACAMLLNLNWTFGGIEWTAKLGGDAFSEVQSWFDSSPTS